MGKRRSKTRRAPGFSEEGKPLEGLPAVPSQQVVELGAGGRLVIPASMREALGMKIGDRLTVRLDGNQVSIYTYEEGIRRAREIIGKYLPENAVDEFLKWKREEAAREWAKMERWSRDD
jgi:AbrB family looped-hinge helix DNA binding protein